MNSTQIAPSFPPPSLSRLEPTARSSTPSPSKSPIFSISVPNIASPLIFPLNPPSVSLILDDAFTVPSVFKLKTQTAPCQYPPSPS